MSARMKICVLTLCSVLFSLLLAVGVDRAVGQYRYRGNGQKGLLFVPNAQTLLRTPEFQSVAFVNQLGFRDRDFAVPRNGDARVLAIGDSFTFGWGLNIEDTWVKQLEGRLRRSGHPVEIANLGRGGTYPKLYADVAERAIPMLKPDLVLIPILQGDDLAQGRADIPAIKAELHAGVMPPVVAKGVREMFPNLMALLRPAVVGSEAVMQANEWAKRAAGQVAKLDATRKAKWDSFDPVLQKMYLDGNLNPGLLEVAMGEPEHLMMTMKPESELGTALIAEMGRQVARIRRVAEENGSRVLVLSIPSRTYVNRFGWEQTKRMGFAVTAEMLTSTAPDDAIRMASEKAGVPFFAVTADFRREGSGRRLYFEFDGHLDREGSLLLAELLEPTVQRALGK